MNAAIVVAVWSLNVPVALGQSSGVEDAAHEHYRRGTAAYNLGRYLEAAREYEQAYEVTLDSALLFNVAQAYRLAGDRRKAITTYRSYLRSAPNGSQRGIAELKLRELEGQPNNDVPATSPRPADDQTALPAPISVPPALTVAPREAPASGADAPRAAPTLTLERETEPAPTGPIYTRWPFWAVTGAAAVAIVVVTIVIVGGSSSSPANTDLGTMRF